MSKEKGGRFDQHQPSTSSAAATAAQALHQSTSTTTSEQQQQQQTPVRGQPPQQQQHPPRLEQVPPPASDTTSSGIPSPPSAAAPDELKPSAIPSRSSAAEYGEEEDKARQVIAVSASRGPAAFFNLARKFLVTDEICDLSALEGAIVSAVDAAHLLERSKLATIVR